VLYSTEHFVYKLVFSLGTSRLANTVSQVIVILPSPPETWLNLESRKPIEDLPLNGRDLTAFSTLVAGYSGTYSGLPSTDQGSNIDGVMGNSSRMKFTGKVQPAVSPRLEDIEQMGIQTDQLDLNNGFGQSSTQVNFISRRGSNQFHGRVYEDFRNSGLNANSWTNNVNGLRRNKLIM
jgi:hypothetical protein